MIVENLTFGSWEGGVPEAIIDWSTGYFDKISLFVYANLEELFQEGREQKKHCRPRKCYFHHWCLRPKDEATVFPPLPRKGPFLNTPTLEDVS